MQHRYFGDVGDFGKYGLLRALCGGNGGVRLKLGVVWYAYPDESHNADGKHVGYLQTSDFAYRNCDPVLYDLLRGLLFNDLVFMPERRHLRLAREPGLLPEGTVFFEEPLAFSPSASLSSREAMRTGWIRDALKVTVSAEMVFLDPDNGIECVSVRRTSAKGPKYAYWDDIRAFVERGQSVIVYHHLNRSASHDKQVATLLAEFGSRFPGLLVDAVRFVRGTVRAYFVVIAERHRGIIDRRLQEFAEGNWQSHFTRGDSNSHGVAIL